MRILALITALAMVTTIAAHAVFTTLLVDGVNQGAGTCIRMPKDGGTANAPILDLSATDMACNVDGDLGVSRICPALPGSHLTFVWRIHPDASQPGAFDPSHKGPCAVYMKHVDDAESDVGHGDGWFKIFDEAYDTKTGAWCTEKLIAADGLLSANIPKNLAGGYYLVRPELLALHEVDQPQFYTGCAQIFVSSSESGVPRDTVSIPGYVKLSDPGMSFNIYDTDASTYPMHGPPVAKIDSRAANAKIRPAGPAMHQSKGLKPAHCVLQIGNWCGEELAEYHTYDDCWAQSKICYEQLETCYDKSGITNAIPNLCQIWDDKCDAQSLACYQCRFRDADCHGPPNKGKDLNPEKEKFDPENTAGEPKLADLKRPVGIAPSKVDSSTMTFPSGAFSSRLPLTTLPPVSILKTLGLDPKIKTVYATKTVTVSATQMAKRQEFKFNPAADVPEDDATANFQFKPEGVQEESANFKFNPEDAAVIWQSPPRDPKVVPVATFAQIPPIVPSIVAPASAPEASVALNPDLSVNTRTLIPTIDGSCGVVAGYTCTYTLSDEGVATIHSMSGCCSRYGYCGFTDEYCGAGCQAGFGLCGGGRTLAKRLESALDARKEIEKNLLIRRQFFSQTAEIVTVTPTCKATLKPTVKANFLFKEDSSSALPTATLKPNFMFIHPTGSNSTSSGAQAEETEKTFAQCGATSTRKTYCAIGCCSKDGFCGDEDYHCGTGCQHGFGFCKDEIIFTPSASPSAEPTSTRETSRFSFISPTTSDLATPTGESGFDDNFGTIFAHCGPFSVGNSSCASGCCSEFGFCGDTNFFCGRGCQADYGLCGPAGKSNSTSTTSLLEPVTTAEPERFEFKDDTTPSSTSFTVPAPMQSGLEDFWSGVQFTQCGPTSLGKASCQSGCCSSFGFCGTEELYCGSGCQDKFGLCGDAGKSASAPEPTRFSFQEDSVDAGKAASQAEPTRFAFHEDAVDTNKSTAPVEENTESIWDGITFAECGAPSTSKMKCPTGCCFKDGFCGSSAFFCGDGCQDKFGLCGEEAATASSQRARASQLFARQDTSKEIVTVTAGNCVSFTSSVQPTTTSGVEPTETAAPEGKYKIEFTWPTAKPMKPSRNMTAPLFGVPWTSKVYVTRTTTFISTPPASTSTIFIPTSTDSGFMPTTTRPLNTRTVRPIGSSLHENFLMAAATKVANSPPGGAAARLKLEAAKITEEKLDAIRKEQKVRRHIREFRMRHVMGYVGGAVRGI